MQGGAAGMRRMLDELHVLDDRSQLLVADLRCRERRHRARAPANGSGNDSRRLVGERGRIRLNKREGPTANRRAMARRAVSPIQHAAFGQVPAT